METSRSPQEAAQELLKRRSTRRSLTEWTRHKGFEPAKHHTVIISEIESFITSDDDVLLLFAPPGSAKSTYVSILLPSWYLANNPTHSILAATHSVEFAERWDDALGTTSPQMSTFSASSYRRTAKLPRAGRWKAGVNITA